MAHLFPPYETILKLRQKPTEGELAMLDCLVEHLDDSFEIYFQPFINGDMPDIIIMKEGHGVYIIEVKDWVLKHYNLNSVQDWYYENNRIKSPFHQVNKYKENLFNLHIEGLAEKNILNSNHWRIIKCAVYFHKETTQALEAFIKPGYPPPGDKGTNRYADYIKFLGHFDFLGFNDLNRDYVRRIETHAPFKKLDPLFDNETYLSLKRYLSPPQHALEEGKVIKYSAEQKKVIESKSNSKQKARGVAGSGKTHCLAKRAVNAHLRTKDKVLILTFNITLRNYIHDKISEVREAFSWGNFHIIHFHEFFISLLNDSGIKESMDVVLKTPEILSRLNCPKYNSVLIDEIQDYESLWTEFIKNYILEKEGELVVFGDEKQNIYERRMDEKERKPYTGIGGQWNLLKRSYRVSNSIAKLAELYQKFFFKEKYEFDEILIQRDLFENSHLDFYSVDKYSPERIWTIVREAILKYKVHDNDVCIQATKVEPLRMLEDYVNKKHRVKTTTMFERQDVYEELRLKENDPERLRKRLEGIRRSKKFHFWNNPGIMKFCTIHSYKGWEIDTLVLLVGKDLSDADDPSREEYVSDELIYTAITRCRNNLIVIEVGGNKYENFFKGNMAIVN